MRRIPVSTGALPTGFAVTSHRLHHRGGHGVRVISSVAASEPKPAIIWMHGGGYMMGRAKQDDGLCGRLAERTGTTVVSVDYRLAPEHPYPTPLHDCLAAYEFICRDAQALGIDPTRVVIGGKSAGGGLAAALALLIHDRGLPAPCLQLLIFPMLDDRTNARVIDGKLHRLWNHASNRHAWASYLGATGKSNHIPDYAAPARRGTLAGLPPAWVGVGTADLFHDECVAYATRLRLAGVPTDLDIVEGAFHAFDVVAPNAPVSQRFFESQVSAIRRALAQPELNPTPAR